MALQVGAHYLERPQGGRGVLLGGVPGVPPANVLVIGGGVAGTNAALIASGMGAEVTVVDAIRKRCAASPTARRRRAHGRSRPATRSEAVCRRADLVIGTVLVPGATAPKLITAATVKAMKPGSVIVDVAIDQGGMRETSRPTTHSQPTYVVDDVVHYCVTNMPGAVARTSTFALNNATLPFVLALADKGMPPRAERGPASAQRPQCARRPGDVPGGRGSAGPEIHAARAGAAAVTLSRRPHNFGAKLA